MSNLTIQQKNKFSSIAIVLCVFLAIFCVLVNTSHAAFNQEINYQGKLLDSASAPVADGDYSIVFRLYDDPVAGTTLWTETDTVTVTSGLFSIMLGSTTPLTGVDFNQTLYLGLNVAADGEMTPRKVLGAVPAAFEAKALGGATSTQYLRSDQATALEATVASTLLTLTQGGVGDILNLFDGGTEVLTVLDGGNVGIGTTSPVHNFSVAGDVVITGALYDNNYLAGTSGMVLQTTGVGFEWVATSTLGISNGGASDFLSLTDTPGGYLAGALLFASSTGSELSQDASLTYDADSSVFTGSGNQLLFADTSVDGHRIGALVIDYQGSSNPILSSIGDEITWGDDFLISATTPSIGAATTIASTFSIVHNRAGENIQFRVATSTTGILETALTIDGPTANILVEYGLLGIQDATPDFGVEIASTTGSGYFGITNVSDGDILTVSSNGYIGVGTTTPASTLDVWGDMRVGTTSTPNLFVSSAEDFVAIGTDVNTYGHKLTVEGGIGTTGSFSYYYNSERLASLNNSGGMPQLQLSNNSGIDTDWEIGFGTGDDHDFELRVDDQTSGDKVILNADHDTGYIGIGTSSPVHRLSVAGDVIITGALYDSAYSSGVNGMVLQTTGIGFEWVATSSLGIGGGSALTFGTDNQIPYVNAGSTDFDYSGNLLFDGSTLSVQTTGTADILNLFETGGTEVFTVLENGNVGIGTTSPQGYYNLRKALVVSDDSFGAALRLNGTADLELVGGNSSGFIGTRSNHDLLFATNNTTRMAMSAAGFTGIGTTTPASTLDVWGDFRVGTSSIPALSVNSADGFVGFGTAAPTYTYEFLGSHVGPDGYFNMGNALTVQSNGNVTVGGANDTVSGTADNLVIGNSGQSNGMTILSNTNGESSIHFGSAFASGGSSREGQIAFDHVGNDLIFGFSNVEQMRLRNDGLQIGTSTTASSLSAMLSVQSEATSDIVNLFESGGAEVLTVLESGGVGIGTSSPLSLLDVYGDFRVGTSTDGVFFADTSSGYIGVGTTTPDQTLDVIGTIQVSNLLGGATGLSTDANGNIIRDPSDLRLKENVYNIENALDKVLDLRGVTYTWKDENRFGSQTEVGFIAQEVDLIIPEVVRKGGDYWSLNTQNIVAVVVGAVQEIWKELTTTNKRVTELESEVAQLRSVIESLNDNQSDEEEDVVDDTPPINPPPPNQSDEDDSATSSDETTLNVEDETTLEDETASSSTETSDTEDESITDDEDTEIAQEGESSGEQETPPLDNSDIDDPLEEIPQDSDPEPEIDPEIEIPEIDSVVEPESIEEPTT